MRRLRHGAALLALGVLAALAVQPAFAVATPRGAPRGGPQTGPRSGHATVNETADQPEHDRLGFNGGETNYREPARSAVTPTKTPFVTLPKTQSRTSGNVMTALLPSAPALTLALAPASATPVVVVPPVSRLAVPLAPELSAAPVRVLPTTWPMPGQPPIAAIAPVSASLNHPNVDPPAGTTRASTGVLGPTRAATKLSVPVGLLLIVAVFLIVQAGLNRRDPKWTDAPATPDDDALSFS
ncbi:MAG TPA: hypothetical protein VLL25_07920 [Acidimicrobiales bacterium]|nr:hypothetical protein [Acidimicrobiales bacterium]